MVGKFTICALLAGWILLAACSQGETEEIQSLEETISSQALLGLPASVESAWYERFSVGEPDLKNIPLIKTLGLGKEGRFLHVLVSNVGTTTLNYSGYSEDYPQFFAESYHGDHWKTGDWNWCGTGMEEYTLSPGSSRELLVPIDREDRKVRVTTVFSEEENDLSAWVTLAEFDPY